MSTSASHATHHPGTRLRRPVVAPDAVGVQGSLDDLGTDLRDVTFVVVDLETTGTAASTDAITEIGAVKVRGGEILGEFQTLVNPGGPVPPQITVLTGITTAMVIDAPRIQSVLPSFLEFARGSVLVAHNARFDVGFLKAAARATDTPWPGFEVVDTVALARRVVPKDEVRNHRLGTLAALFGATTVPDHRALSDARATVDVLHALLGRLAPWGITHLEDLASAVDPVPPAVRAKRHLADGTPRGPGVYMFHAPDGEVLYVGTSVDVRTRVRSYFTRAETRRRMAEMVTIAERVSAVPCATRLEAQVRELRLIAEHSPRYNRRSRFPERMPWVRLTDEPHPRLSIVTQVVAEHDAGASAGRGHAGDPARPSEPADDDVRIGAGAWHIGPFLSRRTAQAALEGLQSVLDLRRCTRRLPLVARTGAAACPLLDLGRCAGPCVAGDDDAGRAARAAHDAEVVGARLAMGDDPSSVVERAVARITRYATEERYEQAAVERDRLAALLDGSARRERFAQMSECAELVAARARDDGAWEIVVVRHGRLATTAVAPVGTDPYLTIEAAAATAEAVQPPVAPATAAHPEETLLLLDWLDSPGVRLVRTTHPFSCAVRGPGAYEALATQARRARATGEVLPD
ncbi:DEDD exonuclease domain-containing protein [Sanguibacter sp. HDW7]|uniref:DEDD exonuclease domain-containing protein n=1 Tax=Sanguibacter sp. HDW7 TaxID=2714931 RepID=UPI001F0E41F6|nr:DEDD exonuclease domain-containing protein [Sanguibacter sp. HDW7]